MLLRDVDRAAAEELADQFHRGARHELPLGERVPELMGVGLDQAGLLEDPRESLT